MIHIMGTCVTVGILSLNGYSFLPSELRPLHGKVVPLLWEHNGSPDKAGESIEPSNIIGRATTYWHEPSLQLRYIGKVEEQYSSLVRDSNGVSIGCYFKQLGFWPTKILLEEVRLCKYPSFA